MDILSVVTRVPILMFGVERHDDDFADRINYKYTVAVLVIFAIIVTNRQFGTKQIHCWIPAYFTRNYEEYINDICWVSNTYYISLDQKLPEAEQIRKSFELKYYQWVPFILLSQAFFFYIPHIAWRALSRRSGIDVRDIVEAASNYKSVDKYESRQKYMTYMLTAVDQYVDDPRRRKEARRSLLLLKRLLSGICCISGKFLGNYLMVLYLFIKLAFIGNCLCQLFVLNLLLGHEFHKFGFELIDKIINGKGWDTGSRIFPKISMCDFRIREIGNPKVSHRYTVQCVLPINLFNQQIFTFIWFWYGLVLIINIYSLCVWTYRFLPSKRLRYVSRRIEIMRQALLWSHKQRQQPTYSLNFEQIPDLQLHDFERDLIKHFVHDYLESDGLFILRVLSSNTSDFVCTELIQELWKYYRKQRKFNRSTSEDEDNEDDLFDDESLTEFKKSLEDFTSHGGVGNANTNLNRLNSNNSLGEKKRPPNIQPKRRINNQSMPAGVMGPRPKIVRARKKPSIQFRENDQQAQQQQQIDENYTTNEQPFQQYETDTAAGVSEFEQSDREAAVVNDNIVQPHDNLVDNNNNKESDLDNQTGNSARRAAATAAANPGQKNGSIRANNTKNLNKPLAVISEQIASIYNKSKKQPSSEKVTVTVAQTTQVQRLKIVNRTTSLEQSHQHQQANSNNNQSPNQQQQSPPPATPSTTAGETLTESYNFEYTDGGGSGGGDETTVQSQHHLQSPSSPQQQQAKVKLKRPTHFARKLLNADTGNGGGGDGDSTTIQTPPQPPTSSPPNKQQSTLTSTNVEVHGVSGEHILVQDGSNEVATTPNQNNRRSNTSNNNNTHSNNNSDNNRTDLIASSNNDEKSKTKYLETET